MGTLKCSLQMHTHFNLYDFYERTYGIESEITTRGQLFTSSLACSAFESLNQTTSTQTASKQVHCRPCLSLSQTPQKLILTHSHILF